MVHGVDNSAPNKKHNFRDEVAAEARRLATISRGNIFTVLEVVEAYYVPPVEAVKLTLEEYLPF